MKRFLVPFLITCLVASRAGAQFARAPEVPRSRGAAGTFVSLADDASALFVNPAGTILSAPLAACVDYAEPAGFKAARESRIAVAAAARVVGAGLGWYRFKTDAGSDNLLLLNANYRVVEGARGSFISLGGNVGLGSATRRAADGRKDDTWRGVTGDLGLMLRPLPVVSFAFVIGNLGGTNPGETSMGGSCGIARRWGASYFWQERVALSIAGERIAGGTTLRYGLVVKTAVPLELMAGFSDGHATGGIRWAGDLLSAVVSFSADEVRRVTWAGGFEMRMRRDANGGQP